jgi:predicted nucleic acid-binding protein
VEHPYREPCEAILRRVEIEEHDFTIDSEALQEIMNVFVRRGERLKAIEKITSLITAFPGVLSIGAVEIARAAQLLGNYPMLNTRDAVHAAVVQVHGLEGIVSTDRAFDSIPGFKRFDPMEMA